MVPVDISYTQQQRNSSQIIEMNWLCRILQAVVQCSSAYFVLCNDERSFANPSFAICESGFASSALLYSAMAAWLCPFFASNSANSTWEAASLGASLIAVSYSFCA